MAQKIATALGKPTGVAVLVDSRLGQVSARVQPLVEALAARLPRVRRLDLPAGESCKTLAAIEKTCDWLADNGYDRGAALLGIGGGATSDHTGFAAAIYLRGVAYATFPTTLLAMVDASVGGKTGVDIAAGKNLVGAFHQPRAVVADLGFLDSLPSREIAAGMAEVVKAGLIGRCSSARHAGGARPARPCQRKRWRKSSRLQCGSRWTWWLPTSERADGARSSTSATPLATPSRPHPDSNFCTARRYRSG